MTPRTPSQPMRSPTSRIGHLPQGSGLAILGAFLFACPAGAATLAPPPALPCVCEALPAPVIEAEDVWPGWGEVCPWAEEIFDKAPLLVAGDAGETTDGPIPAAPWEAAPLAVQTPRGGPSGSAASPAAGIAAIAFGGGGLVLPVGPSGGRGPSPEPPTFTPPLGPTPIPEPGSPRPPAVPIPAPGALLILALAALTLRRRTCPIPS